MGVGPAFAIPEAVRLAGLALDDIDVFEINEAFASQARGPGGVAGVGGGAAVVLCDLARLLPLSNRRLEGDSSTVRPSFLLLPLRFYFNLRAAKAAA